MAKKTRPSGASPTLTLAITDEARETAVQSNSGGCLIADAIKNQYPQLSNVQVDMATIRVTDRAKGARYIYLTPPNAQHVLLSFDQGWPNPVEEVVVRRAVQVLPITASPKSSAERKQRREERMTDLRARVEAGETLSRSDRTALTRMENHPIVELDRPSSTGPTSVVTRGSGSEITVVGGTPIAQGAAHPNLLRGRNRHFGAKLADPGQAFKDAVEQTVAERLAAQE
jgi:hypothetical protein